MIVRKVVYLLLRISSTGSRTCGASGSCVEGRLSAFTLLGLLNGMRDVPLVVVDRVSSACSRPPPAVYINALTSLSATASTVYYLVVALTARSIPPPTL